MHLWKKQKNSCSPIICKLMEENGLQQSIQDKNYGSICSVLAQLGWGPCSTPKKRRLLFSPATEGLRFEGAQRASCRLVAKEKMRDHTRKYVCIEPKNHDGMTVREKRYSSSKIFSGASAEKILLFCSEEG